MQYFVQEKCAENKSKNRRSSKIKEQKKLIMF